MRVERDDRGRRKESRRRAEEEGEEGPRDQVRKGNLG